MIYHPEKGQRVVKDEAEHKNHLKDGWQEKPIPEKAPEAEADPVGDRIAALEARVDALEAKKKK
jgi:hypothetical protein